MLALVTGGDRGIGFAIAKKLAENGIGVVIAARDRKRLADAKKKLEGASKAGAWALDCDVTSKGDLEKLARSVSKIGPLDILINDAGVAFRKNLADNSDGQIDAMIDVNIRGLIHCTKTFLPAMLERRKGMIINISSGAGKTGFPGLAVYCATKFAVIGFTESLAQETAGDGVLVYAICPGATETDMWHSLYPGEKADFTPEDVAVEVMETIRHAGKIEPGRAIDVRKR